MRDLDALEALLAAATPGPWEARRDLSGWSAWHDGMPIEVGHEGGLSEPDARAIVALRNVAPELLVLARDVLISDAMRRCTALRVRRCYRCAGCRLNARADALRAKLREVTG